MKIPKTFIPKKGLEEKTKQLLEEPKKNEEVAEENIIWEELKTEFPRFADYLFELYPDLGIVKFKDKKGSDNWKFYINHQKTTNPFLVGKIERYIEQCGKDLSEYGYHVKILIEGNWHLLKHRIGHYCFDTANTVVSTKDLLRYDKEKDIPFP